MVDRHRRFWRLARRYGSGGPFLGLMAALGVLAMAIVALAVYLSERTTSPSAMSDSLILFGLMSGVQLLIWGGMALASRRRRRGDMVPGDVALEVLLSGTGRQRSWRLPTVWVMLAAALAVGALELLATSSPLVGLLAGTDTAIVFLLVRWAWPPRRPPVWRMAVAALYGGIGLASLQGLTKAFGGRLSASGAIVDGALVSGAMLGVGLLLRHIAGRHPRLALAFDVRDTALELASNGHTKEGLDRLIGACEGNRVALEMAREMLRTRSNDEIAVHAMESIDQAIETTEWGRWPWSPAVPGSR